MKNHIELLQWYYKFLSLGKFFESEAKSRPFPVPTQVVIATGDRTKFAVNVPLTSSLLQEIHKHPDSKNVFGYLTEISAFRGIFSIMREMIEKVPTFRAALQSLLGDQYFPFEQTIRFLRNVLTHSSTTTLLIQAEDFQKQTEFLLTSPKAKETPTSPPKERLKIRLHFVYKDHLPEREGSADYACDTEIDFTSLKPQTSLRKVVSLHQMYLLSELCYNLSKVIAQRIHRATTHKPVTSPKQSKNPLKTPSKSPWKSHLSKPRSH